MVGELHVPVVDTKALVSSISQKKTTVAIEAVEDAMIATVTQVNTAVKTTSDMASQVLKDPMFGAGGELSGLTAEAVTKLAPSLKVVQQVTSALTAVASTHPVIGIVVSCLTALFKLELQRRQNNAKAITLCNQVADTVSILKDLKKVEDESGLKKVLQIIADHIKQCEEFLTLYTTKGTMLRILKSMSYNDKMKSLAVTFDNDKKLLSETLGRVAVLGIDEANKKLDSQDQKLDDILAILGKRSPEEIAANKFAERHEVKLTDVAESENLLRRLAVEMNDNTTNIRQLRSELGASVDELLERNRADFMTAFDSQTQLITEGIDKILTAVEAGPWQKIEHTDMQALWRQERWKGSVPRHVFMEALSGFYEDFFTRYPTAAGAICARWITSQHWAAMAECVDVDESGYIGIKELNLFTSALPSGWTLPSWFAYAGVGDKIRILHDFQMAEQLMNKLDEHAKKGGINAGNLERFVKKIDKNLWAVGRLWCWSLGKEFVLPDEKEGWEDSSSSSEDGTLNEGEGGDADADADSDEYSDDDLDNMEPQEAEEDDICLKDQAHGWAITSEQYLAVRGNDPVDTHYGSLNAIIKIVVQQLHDEVTAEPERLIPTSHFLAMRKTLKTVFGQYRTQAGLIYHQWCNQRKDPLFEVRFYCNGLFREWISRCHRENAIYVGPDNEEETNEEETNEEDAAAPEQVKNTAGAKMDQAAAASVKKQVTVVAPGDPQVTTPQNLEASGSVLRTKASGIHLNAEGMTDYIPGYTLKPKASVARIRDVERLQSETHQLSTRLERIEHLLHDIAQDWRKVPQQEQARDLPAIVRKHSVKKNKGFKWFK
ncbi:uncharacterized protein EV422DRAFT_187407 [Fimicolochytrium jonesii]|uniref:uncharacterized protein n=1 Tax=Fimicolochytrium jonesii TaxID=1396493 RepID=UPI0022FE007C|nr:uncharacterized protein EV422DRAFT_338056 [Fimicolochytrium jonesii]XP_052923395.1 uncharacterized protein EV422DRAFT_187407 [Fimicolochytrium jonesii]KAI8815980.1 hypothetical protein EV422DRAFT_338056 [Fimicolochytrium jonesii]KAI8818427.1 hypothetical protein EV422DRAFT_187407 [Fimicolochytrium jonesii]